MAQAYGLYTHIRANRRRSVLLLIGLFFLVYVMVFAGALAARAFTDGGSLDELLRQAGAICLSLCPSQQSRPRVDCHRLPFHHD